jgi:hypothetical protein
MAAAWMVAVFQYRVTVTGPEAARRASTSREGRRER